jgi:undecaprenyl pyrophosphate phosphatase UppP
MNNLINYGFDVLILTVVILIVGLIKPKWILFWMQRPDRFIIMVICSVMFMIGMTLFGEGNKQKQLAEQAVHAPTKSADVPTH